MRIASRFLGLAVMVGLVSATASQAATFSLVGVADSNTPSVGGGSDTYGSKFGLGGGALLDFGVGSWKSFEIGALYVNRETNDTTLGVTTSAHAIEVPVLLRWWLHPMFSIAAGGYYAQGIGNVTTSGNETSSQSYSDAGYKTNDLGLTGSVAFRLPITTSMRFLVDGRYNYGLTNVSSDSDTTIKNRDVQLLLGLQFSMRSNR